jgi:uncharacterized protein (DUF433 family)
MALSIHTPTIPLRSNADGSVIYVGQTRVPLETVIYLFNTGSTPEEMVFDFPALSLTDVYQVIGYYLEHRAEVDIYVRQVQAESERLRHESRARPEVAALRERLLAHKHRQA